MVNICPNAGHKSIISLFIHQTLTYHSLPPACQFEQHLPLYLLQVLQSSHQLSQHTKYLEKWTVTPCYKQLTIFKLGIKLYENFWYFNMI